MPHSLDNPKSVQILEQKLRSAFDVEVRDGFPWMRGDELTPFTTEALKSVGDWISEGDILHLVVEGYFKKCPTTTKLSGRFYEITPKAEADAVIEYILSTLKSLPASYTIAFPVPRITGTPALKEMAWSDRVRLCPKAKIKLSDLLLPTIPQSVIEIDAIGYAKSDRHQSAMRDAISSLKVACHVGHMSNLFSARPATSRMAEGGIALSANRTETTYSAIITLNGEYQGMAPLGSGLSKYLGSVTIPDNFDVSHIEKAEATARELMFVLYHPIAQNNVRSLRRAIEWAFDARIDEDNTTRFLKTCIGLEAALTEQNDEIGITQQLADRCAFILNKTSSAREETRKKIREIYKLRSKIVHGAVEGLSPHQTHLSENASDILSSVLSVEIKGVLEWFKTQKLAIPAK
jgi:hypothetical protein